jgi:hypothetical protein
VYPLGRRKSTGNVSISNVIATLMHTLFDVGQVRLMPGITGEVSRVITGGEPIRQLVS